MGWLSDALLQRYRPILEARQARSPAPHDFDHYNMTQRLLLGRPQTQTDTERGTSVESSNGCEDIGVLERGHDQTRSIERRHLARGERQVGAYSAARRAVPRYVNRARSRNRISPKYSTSKFGRSSSAETT